MFMFVIQMSVKSKFNNEIQGLIVKERIYEALVWFSGSGVVLDCIDS